ncbi:MAG: 50S ribosomal protein L3 [Gemmatimonadales bacterium]|jgi:large subunit ribosomal protein L3|nr:50S ribosomal protein L3 [Gemmatimonadales bacterium]MBT3772947.1 50S ribosomal protein L3 [Gemmatimonadales bacterium]MBT3957122.1 50S ribosomal protein L3 [Gemmatimonadales bacterium]MBT4437130.1 50S ribosomal protein L3 [Gemmatimonadales bacterium]MBT4913659.1 50S ribosomal protein L3 [Gemmatimonadales bacterium]
MAGLIGKKVGMTRIFNDDGVQVPVTVIEAGPCPVVMVRSDDADGYTAVQVGFGAQKAKRANKAEVGHAVKAGLEAAPQLMREFTPDNGEVYEVGQELTVALFEAGDRIRITGRSKGKGFQGVVKRYGFAGRPASHGHSMSRTPGSMGPGTDPSRVIKGKKLPGRMGGARTTIRNLQVVRVDGERNLLFVKGGVPGARNSYLLISK